MYRLPIFCEGGDFNKFIVVKKEDAENYLPYHDLIDLAHILKQTTEGRLRNGKSLNKYLVINIDESYASEIVEILKRNGHWG